MASLTSVSSIDVKGIISDSLGLKKSSNPSEIKKNTY